MLVMASTLTGCATRERLFSEQQGSARATPVLRIEKHIAQLVRSNGDWEMSQFRKYRQEDVDGDGSDDVFLLTTFEHGLIWRRELFVCLSSSPERVMQINLGCKGERRAEDFEIEDRVIIVRGKAYSSTDALCCPSQPYESTFLIANGRIIERHWSSVIQTK